MEATPAYAGIDWSWQHHALCVVDRDGQRIEEATVAHSRPGLAKITTMLARHGVSQVGIERGDGPVVEHLLRDGFEVVVISSRQVKSLRARYGSAGLPPPPRSQNPGPRLDQDPVALLARPRPLQPRPTRPSQPHRSRGSLT